MKKEEQKTPSQIRDSVNKILIVLLSLSLRWRYESFKGDNRKKGSQTVKEASPGWLDNKRVFFLLFFFSFFLSLGLLLIVHFKNNLRGKVGVEGLEKLKGVNKESLETKDKNKAFLLLTETH